MYISEWLCQRRTLIYSFSFPFSFPFVIHSFIHSFYPTHYEAAGIIKEAMNASWISSFTLLIFQFFYWISSNLLALFERPPDHFFQSFKVFVKPLCQDHTHAQQFNEDCRGSRTARNKMAKQRQVKETVRLSGEFLVRSLVTDIVLMVVVFLVWSSSAFVFSLFNMYNHAVMMLLTTALCLLGLLTMHYQSRPSRRSVFRH